MIKRLTLMAGVALLLGACAKEDAPDFCGDHALFHAEHAASTATLSVTMSEDGTVSSDLRFPAKEFDTQSTMNLLQNVSNVYVLQTAAACGATDATVSSNDESVLASYATECGADNKLAQVDVALFDTLPSLGEVEVTVVTTATQKHFLINRQCATAIFRFE